VAPLPYLARWRNAVRESDRLDTTAVAVLYTISTYANKHGEAFPGKPLIARGAKLKLDKRNQSRAVDAAILRAEAAGFLTVKRSKGGRRSNRYLLTIPTPRHGAGLEDEYPASDGAIPRVRSALAPRGDAGESFESNGKPLLTQQEQTAKARELNERLLRGART